MNRDWSEAGRNVSSEAEASAAPASGLRRGAAVGPSRCLPATPRSSGLMRATALVRRTALQSTGFAATLRLPAEQKPARRDAGPIGFGADQPAPRRSGMSSAYRDSRPMKHVSLLVAGLLAVAPLLSPVARAEEPTTFLAAQSEAEYLARDHLIGANVHGAEGTVIGSVDDLIVNDENQIVGVVLGTGGYFGFGEKKVGVALASLKFDERDGKLTVSLPDVTRETLAAAPDFERRQPPKSLLERAKERAIELGDKTRATTKDAIERAQPTIDHAKQKAQEAYDKAREAVSDALDTAKEAVDDATAPGTGPGPSNEPPAPAPPAAPEQPPAAP